MSSVVRSRSANLLPLGDTGDPFTQQKPDLARIAGMMSRPLMAEHMTLQTAVHPCRLDEEDDRKAIGGHAR